MKDSLSFEMWSFRDYQPDQDGDLKKQVVAISST